jgi:primosomal protein N''
MTDMAPSKYNLDTEPYEPIQNPRNCGRRGHQGRNIRMKTLRSLKALALLLMLSLAFGWVGGGCASSSGSSSAPKPGSGIAEYREVTREAHRSVAATVKSLESLAQPPAQPLLQHPALPGFDRAFHQLELTSVKVRSRAEAIIMRGQAYFDEWMGNVSAITNQAVARAETEKYGRLLEHFDRVRQQSGEVREEFRSYMANLREFRARLDRPANAAGGELAAQNLEGMTARGRRVLKALEAIETTLSAAEAEVHATLATKK